MLAEIRRIFGLTQKELAEKVGLTQNYYTLVENQFVKSFPTF